MLTTKCLNLDTIARVEVLFLDFDGVIKDSVSIKSDAFENLFLKFGHVVAKKIRKHHENHGGVSRYEKVPLYLSWVNEPVTEENINYYCNQFSLLVKKAVIDSPWVPGVLRYLRMNHKKQRCILVTATPKDEIEYILKKLDIIHLFDRIFGAPTQKDEAISFVLDDLNIKSSMTLMIGDSTSDYEAAMINNIPFLLRRTPLNKLLQKKYKCLTFKDFTDE